MKLRYILFLLLITLGIQFTSAQVSCLNTLREAKNLYEQGLIDEIPTLLSGCMESGFTRSQRIEAYKLIILAYLFDDDQFAAERMMDEFLKKFPEYEVMPNDPVEFVYLLESYKTSSFYSINLTFGSTFTNPVILEHYSSLDRSVTESENSTGTGFHIGLGLSRNIIKSVNLNVGIFYNANNYSFLENSEYGEVVESTEESRRIDVPLTLTYSMGQGNLDYVLRFGGLAGFLTKSTNTHAFNHNALNNPIRLSKDVLESRRKVDLGVVIGGALEYKIPRGYLILDLRYNLGLTNIVLADKRYKSPEYHYIDDDFRLNSFMVSVGYHFSIYQSKKDRF